MTRSPDRNPMIYSRMDPDEIARFQRIADRMYDGNLSLFVRMALRKFADEIDGSAPQRDEQGEKAA